MSRIAVLVDLSYFLPRYFKQRHAAPKPVTASSVARAVHETALAHVGRNTDELFRILVYDCRPLRKKAHNPISGRSIDFSASEMFRFRSDLHLALVRLRKVALRYGELADHNRWIIRERPTKQLLSGRLRVDQLREEDVAYHVTQKGVDIRMSLDIASMAYKRLVDRVVLITGDSDFVPAAKLARREGLDVVLDPLWGHIKPSLNEHIDGLKTHWPRRKRDATDLSRLTSGSAHGEGCRPD